MPNPLRALRHSSDHLRQIAEGLDAGQLDAPAYPSEWSIADVLSHLGSGAVILQRRLADALRGTEPPAEFSHGVWDEWNAKTPVAQRVDALAADQEFLICLESLSADERAGFRFAMGPISEDFTGFVGLRLNEHVLHTWDIEVSLDPAATLSSEASECIIDRLELITRFTGKPVEPGGQLSVHTSDPRRRFVLTLGPGQVSLAPSESGTDPDVELAAEAFIRLVYGRLDNEHTPTVVGGEHLDTLRQVFPGP